jgi:hypothetical protein
MERGVEATDKCARRQQQQRRRRKHLHEVERLLGSQLEDDGRLG